MIRKSELSLRNISKAIGAVIAVFLLSAGSAAALSTYVTAQGGTGTTSPSGILYGDNGSTSHLNTVSVGSGLTFSGGTLSATGGGSGNVSTSTNETAGQLAYWTSNSATPALLGKVATTSATLGLGLSGALTTINNVSQSLSIATSSLYTGATGQVAYFSGTNALTGSSNLFLSGGNVGIGTSTPDARLVVNSAAGVSNRTWAPTSATVAVFDRGGLGSYLDLVTGASGLDRINFGNTNAETRGILQYDNSLDALSLWTATTQRLTINSSGNVGIGTTSPSALLTVAGSQGGILVDRTGNDSYVQLSSNSIAAGQLRYFAPNVLSIADSNGTDRVVFDTSSGNVGIGTTSPYALLSVGGNAVIGASAAGGTPGDLFLPKLGTPSGSFLAVDASGKVIATTTPSGGSGTVTSVALSVPTGLSVSGSPITTSGTLALSLTAGYNIPLTASTTNWNSFYDTPSTRITAGTGLSWSSNTLNCATASGSTQGCLSSTDWTTFNNKVATTRTISTTYPLQGGGDLSTNRTLTLAFGTTTANTWSGLQTFTNTGTTSFSGDVSLPSLKLSAILYAAAGSVSLPSLNFGDVATGLFKSATNALGWAINGVEKMTLNSTGLGVASTSPTYLLSVGNSFGVNSSGVAVPLEQRASTSTAATIDWTTSGNSVLYQTGTSATTISLINATTTLYAGSRKMVTVCNPGGSAGAITWQGVEWAAGTVPTQTTTANQCDTYSFFVTAATSTSASPTYKVFGAMSAGFQ